MNRSEFAKLHPSVIFGYLAAVLVMTMWNRHPWFILLSFGVSFFYAVYLCGRRICRRTIWCGLLILLFAAGILPLFYHNGVTPLYYVNGMAVTAESILYGIMMTFLLLSVLQWFFVWNELMGEEKILYLLGRGMPAVALLITMSLRFVPLLSQRYKEIREAGQGLGDRGRLGWIGKARDGLRDLSVLVSWSLEESIETSVSMEVRGYGIQRRTSFHLFRFRKRDGISLCGIILLFGIVVWNGCDGDVQAQYFPALEYDIRGISLVWCFLAQGILFVAPFVWDLLCRIRYFYNRRSEGQEDLEQAEEDYMTQWFGSRKGEKL